MLEINKKFEYTKSSLFNYPAFNDRGTLPELLLVLPLQKWLNKPIMESNLPINKQNIIELIPIQDSAF